MTDTLILSMALKSGDYKSELHIPLDKLTDPKAVVEQWLDLMQTGFRICATSMDATLAATAPRSGESKKHTIQVDCLVCHDKGCIHCVPENERS